MLSKDQSEKKIRLAVISHLYPDKLNPAQGKFIKDHVELLAKIDWIERNLIIPTPYSIPFTKRKKKNNVELLTENTPVKRIRYLSFPRKIFPSIIARSLSPKIEKHFLNHFYEIAHVHWLYPDGLCIPTLKKLGLKTILTIHGSDWFKNINSSSLRSLIKETFQSANRILLVGPELLNDIQKTFPEFQDKLFQIGNFVDEEFYQIPSKKEKIRAIDALGWDSSKKHFLCVANHRKEKGVDLLLDATSKISTTLSDIHFHIVGANDSESLVLDRKNSTVSFHPPVSPADLIQYYHASDAYISPSRKEGFGLAMIEAAASGLPVVATPTGIAPAFLDENTGILCDQINAEELSIAINYLVKNLNDYSSQSIREKALAMFGKGVYLEKLTGHYRQVLD